MLNDYDASGLFEVIQNFHNTHCNDTLFQKRCNTKNVAHKSFNISENCCINFLQNITANHSVVITLINAVDKDIVKRADSVRDEIDFVLKRSAMCDNIVTLLESKTLPLRVTHQRQQITLKWSDAISNACHKAFCKAFKQLNIKTNF